MLEKCRFCEKICIVVIRLVPSLGKRESYQVFDYIVYVQRMVETFLPYYKPTRFAQATTRIPHLHLTADSTSHNSSTQHTNPSKSPSDSHP